VEEKREGVGGEGGGTTPMNSRNRIKSNEISQAPWKNGNKMHFMPNYKGTTPRATQHHQPAHFSDRGEV